MTGVAVAAANQHAADAGAAVAAAGGNAVDAALAATLVACVTEPGICSIGGGAYVTVWPADGEPFTIDGNVEMPGKDAPPERFGTGSFPIRTEYGGGITTTIGYGSVGTPGTMAALGRAHEAEGRAPWRDVVAPAIAAARDGFPLGRASDYYLDYIHADIYGWHPASHAILHHPDGERYRAGETLVQADLADALASIATNGWRDLHTGDVGRAIAADMERGGGLLTARDLAEYEAVRRRPLGVDVGDWHLAANPPPAIGGTTLVAMLRLLDGHDVDTPDGLRRLVDVQDAVLGYRVRHVDGAADPETVLGVLLELADGDLAGLRELARRANGAGTSPSTAHISTVDADGNACAVTASSGYGSGVVVAGTGIQMNNCLGEHELNVHGVHDLPVGTRLPSNMAPTVGRRRGGAVLSIGSPGADRITTAILQTMVRMTAGLDLQAAVDAPRLHVRHLDGQPLVSHERDLPLPDVGRPTREEHEHAMFFGGVGAAMVHDGRLTVAGDPRRSGGTALSR